jgi:hypothetical protein
MAWHEMERVVVPALQDVAALDSTIDATHHVIAFL